MGQSHSTNIEHVLWCTDVGVSVEGASDQVIRLNKVVGIAYQGGTVDASKHVQAVIQYRTATPKVELFRFAKHNPLFGFEGPFPVKLEKLFQLYS